MEEPTKKSCFWCKSKRHYGIRCKKRPDSLVHAFEIGQKQARISAFEEMRNWARKQGDICDEKRQQHLLGSPDEVIEHAKMKQYDKMEEFSKAKIKEERD